MTSIYTIYINLHPSKTHHVLVTTGACKSWIQIARSSAYTSRSTCLHTHVESIFSSSGQSGSWEKAWYLLDPLRICAGVVDVPEYVYAYQYDAWAQLVPSQDCLHLMTGWYRGSWLEISFEVPRPWGTREMAWLVVWHIFSRYPLGIWHGYGKSPFIVDFPWFSHYTWWLSIDLLN